MNKNQTLLLLGALACGGVLIACGDSSGTGGTGGSTTTTSSVTTGNTSSSSSKASSSSTGTGMGGGFPAPPTLGTQIDRMGRPAINTALDETFLAVNGASPTLSTTALRAAAEDKYNQDGDPLNWTNNTKTFKANLAILDSLDNTTVLGTGCGNQLLACGNADADHGNANCYSTLAGVLADDRLWVKTTSTSCSIYLGVEADATNKIPNQDCGGRRPVDDVIKTTYSLVVAGDLTFSVDDGITPPAGLHPTTFPYLAAPH